MTDVIGEAEQQYQGHRFFIKEDNLPNISFDGTDAENSDNLADHNDKSQYTTKKGDDSTTVQLIHY